MVLLRKIFPLLLIIGFTSTAGAQTRWIDSVRIVLANEKTDSSRLNNLLILSWSMQPCHPDSGVAYALKAIALSGKLRNDVALFHAQAALNASLYYTGDYPMQLDNTFRALTLAKKIKDPIISGYSKSMLCDYYYNIGQYDSSLRYGLQVLDAIRISDPDETEYGYMYTSKLYAGVGDYDSALAHAKRAYQGMGHNKIHERNDWHYQQEMSALYPVMGNAYANKGYYDSAVFYYRSGIVHSTTHQYCLDLVDLYAGMAGVFKATNQSDSAIWYAKKVINEPISQSYRLSMLKASSVLADMYQLSKQPDSALKYLRITLSLKDSLFAREKMLVIQRTVFEEQERQREVVAATVQRNNRLNIAILFISFIILLGAFVVIMKNIRRKQFQRIRNKIADDLHDDIGSTLSSISIMNELAKEKSPEALLLLKTIGENTLALQENMSDIVWTVNAENDSISSVLERMNEFAYAVLEARNIHLEFTSEPPLLPINLSMAYRKNIYLFFKEVINNAAKYSGASNVFVDICKHGHQIQLTIRDDGKGFDMKMHFTGNGLNSMKRRADELNGSLNISSFPGQGTSIRLTFKIP